MQLKRLTTSDALKKRLEKRQKEAVARKIDPETLREVKFGMIFGWDALVSARYSDYGISDNEMDEILRANDKIESQMRLDDARMMVIALSASRAENPVVAFDKMTEKMRKEANNE